MLTPKQKKAIKLMVSGELKQKEIAGEIKVSEQSICAWKKDREFMEEYNRLLTIEIQSAAGKAFKKQKELLAAKSEMVQHMAAKDILDRAGYKPKDKMEVSASLETEITKLDNLIEQIKGEEE